MHTCASYVACVFLICVFARGILCEKARVCIVNGRGEYQKSTKNCPILDQVGSEVTCVPALDRLECLRKISKGQADFAVFTPEDLIIAANAGIDIVVTNELRFVEEEPFQDQFVAVINEGSGIKSRHDLRDKNFCHPGYGDDIFWTRILANYLEASVVPQTCNSFQTLTENRISASAGFFKTACKAGAWVNDPKLDRELKNKYPNLCKLCDDEWKCSHNDKYWGRRGVLYCLTDGIGDISWARLSDVKSHFGIIPGAAVTTPEGYKYLCRDGDTMPLNSSHPCVWMSKPWTVVAASRPKSLAVQTVVSGLTHDDGPSWQNALLNLIETYHAHIKKLDVVDDIDSYLQRAIGFLSANSFTGCHPPRTIRLCTTSNAENAKCGWMKEAASVRGIEPDIDCLKADNTTHCMRAINVHAADVVMVPPDLVYIAKTEYNLKTLFYETVKDEDKYVTVAVVKKGSRITTFEDLKGAKACFPSYNGISWRSVLHTLNEKNLLENCPLDEALSDFFGDSCVGDAPKAHGKLGNLCGYPNQFNKDYEALKCLTKGGGDVAFVSKNSLLQYLQDDKQNEAKYKMSDLRILCPNADNDQCHMSWSPMGQAMVSNGTTPLWFKDTLDVFLQLDTLFGRNVDVLSRRFTMFGPFNGQSNVLFRDNTLSLRTLPTHKNDDKMKREYGAILSAAEKCPLSGGGKMAPSLVVYCTLTYLISRSI